MKQAKYITLADYNRTHILGNAIAFLWRVSFLGAVSAGLAGLFGLAGLWFGFYTPSYSAVQVCAIVSAFTMCAAVVAVIGSWFCNNEKR